MDLKRTFLSVLLSRRANGTHGRLHVSFVPRSSLVSPGSLIHQKPRIFFTQTPSYRPPLPLSLHSVHPTQARIRHFSPPVTGVLDPRASSLFRGSRAPIKAVQSSNSTPTAGWETMNASPPKISHVDSSTTITTTTAAATQASISSPASTPATTTVVSPSPASCSSTSPRVRTALSGSRSSDTGTGSGSRAQQHKSKRHSTSSCDSGSNHDASRIVYGQGAISKLPIELGRLHLSSPLIISSPSRISLARKIQALIPNLESRILDSAVVNVPQRVVDDAVARITGHDVVISVGAGSAIGLAKAVSIRKGIPHICIPTTYSGSEMSPLLAADGRRMGHKGSKIMPTVVIYDEDLTGGNTTPKRISAPSAASSAAANQLSSHDDDDSWSYIHLPGV
ncbi:iron-containing alcohol dehydrogenase domain-containing protein [Sarocladium implicatum]|nr:iron-containing alcohol dehydrogenase domain-containing protein [Sarocladium implicatum]